MTNLTTKQKTATYPRIRTKYFGIVSYEGYNKFLLKEFDTLLDMDRALVRNEIIQPCKLLTLEINVEESHDN